MKITHVSTTLVALPHDEPLADGPTTPGSKNFVALKLGTDQGIEGLGFTFFGGIKASEVAARCISDPYPDRIRIPLHDPSWIA